MARVGSRRVRTKDVAGREGKGSIRVLSGERSRRVSGTSEKQARDRRFRGGREDHPAAHINSASPSPARTSDHQPFMQAKGRFKQLFGFMPLSLPIRLVHAAQPHVYCSFVRCLHCPLCLLPSLDPCFVVTKITQCTRQSLSLCDSAYNTTSLILCLTLPKLMLTRPRSACHFCALRVILDRASRPRFTRIRFSCFHQNKVFQNASIVPVTLTQLP